MLALAWISFGLGWLWVGLASFIWVWFGLAWALVILYWAGSI